MKTKTIVVTGKKKDKQQSGGVYLKNFGDARLTITFNLDAEIISSITIEGRPPLPAQTRKILKNNQAKGEEICHEVSVDQIKSIIIKKYNGKKTNSFNIKKPISVKAFFENDADEQKELDLKTISEKIAKEFQKGCQNIYNLHNGDKVKNRDNGKLIKILKPLVDKGENSFKKIKIAEHNINSYEELVSLFKKSSIDKPVEKIGYYSKYENTREEDQDKASEKKLKKDKATEDSFNIYFKNSSCSDEDSSDYASSPEPD